MPDWHAVAGDWDGVHLSLFGLLTSYLVRVTNHEGSAMLWRWESERTLWFRDVFRSWRDLEDLKGPPRPSVTVPVTDLLAVDDGQRSAGYLRLQ